MKKVKITIEVEVKDEAKFVAVESDGTVYSFGEFPHPSPHGSYFEVEDDVFCESARVSNWYETVTEVKNTEVKNKNRSNKPEEDWWTQAYNIFDTKND